MPDNDDKNKYRKLTGFYESHRRMPTYSEIMELFEFKSKNAAHKAVNKLIDQGLLDKDQEGRLMPPARWSEVPKLGLVEAGIPTAAEEYELDTLSLDKYLIRKREETYIVEVKGESMIEAGIHEGDLVVVERAHAAREGEIVIAEVDGGWTMKYYRRDKNGKVYLEPANKNFKNIYPEYDLKISAIVRGVVRRY